MNWQKRLPLSLFFVLLLTACGTLQVQVMSTPTAAPRAGVPPTMTPIFDRPQFETPSNVTFDGRLTLVGYTIRPQSNGPGAELMVTLIWQVKDEITADYNTYIHLLNDHGQLVAQVDAPTGAGRREPRAWLVDEYIYDQHRLRIPGEMTIADVEIRAGLYDAGSGQQAQSDGPHSVVLSPVASPTPPPPPSASGILALDRSVEAILSNEIAARQDLVDLTTMGCTHVSGLGGPPKCAPDQEEGTLVSYLPVLGPGEGQHVQPEGLARALDFEVGALYGVYRSEEPARSDPAFPSGEYGLLFTIDQMENAEETILFQVNGQGRIVRLDFMIGPLDDRLQGTVAEWLIPPATTAGTAPNQ